MASDTKQLGVIFTWLGWLIGLALLVMVFSKILDAQDEPISSINNGANPYVQIILQRNRNGHYIFNGYVNNKKVKFLVDTGATVTSFPYDLGKSLGLQQGRSYKVHTANGTTTAYATKLKTLDLGDIKLNNVGASLVTGMTGNEALLGMNVLKHFELIQRDGKLIIRQY